MSDHKVVDLDKWCEFFNEVEAMKADLSQALARNKDLEKVLKKAEIALRPFANRVYNDNGDLTINTTHFDSEVIKAAYFIKKKILAALNEQGPGAPEGESLNNLVEKARNHIMTKDEIEAQMDSFVRGQMMDD